MRHIAEASDLVGWACRPDAGGMAWFEFNTLPSPTDDILMEAIDMAFPGMHWLQADECASITSPDSGFLRQYDGHTQYGLRTTQRLGSVLQTAILQNHTLQDLAVRGESAADSLNETNQPNDDHTARSKQPPSEDTNNFFKQLQDLGSTALEKVLNFVLPISRSEDASHKWDTASAEDPGDQVSHGERPISMTMHEESEPSKARTISRLHTNKRHLHLHHSGHQRPRFKRLPLPNDKTTTAAEFSSSKPDRQYATICNIVDLGDKVEVEIIIDEPFVNGQNTAARRRFRHDKLVHNFDFECGDNEGKKTRISFNTPRQNLAEVDNRLSEALPNSIFECAKHNPTNNSMIAEKEGDKAAVDVGEAAMGMAKSLSNPAPPSCACTEKEVGMVLDKRGNCMSSSPPDPLLQFATSCKIKDYHGRADVDISISDPYQSGHCDEAKELIKKNIPSVQRFYCAPERGNTTMTRVRFTASYQDIGKTDAQLHLAFGQRSIFRCLEEAAQVESANVLRPQEAPEIQIEGVPWMGTEIPEPQRIGT